MRLRRDLPAVVLLLVGLALIYARTAAFGYVDYDDVNYVVRTEPVRAGLTLQGVHWAFTAFNLNNWHPLTWISHMLDVSLFGLDPGPAHLVNVAIHGLNSVLVYALALALLRSRGASLVVAFLFMAHPLHVESVAWIAERKDVLCGFFFLLSLLAYLRYAAQPGAKRYAVLVVAFVLALISKPMAVTLPAVLLLLDFWPLGRLGGAPVALFARRYPAYAARVIEKLPLFALSLASSLLTVAAQKSVMAPIRGLPLDFRLMNAVVACATYLRDTLVPTRLSVLYPLYTIDFFRTFLPALVLLATVSTAALVYRRQFPWLLFGWLWLLCTLLPVIGLVQVGVQSHADRYMYLPSLGVFIPLGALLARLHGAVFRRALLALVPALAFYSFIAWVQVGYWSGPYMLFSRALDVDGKNAPAHMMLATFYLREGHVDEARTHALKSLALDPEAPPIYGLLATLLEQDSNPAGAEEALRAGLRRSPSDAQMLNNLGVLLEKQGRLQEARQAFTAALKADPNLYKVRSNLKRVGG